MCSNVYILIVLISLSSWTFANVQFVTKPPRKVWTFPGQNVTLPSAFNNLGNHIVQWTCIESSKLQNNISNNRDVLITNFGNFGQHFSILGDGMNYTLVFAIPDENSIDFGTSTFYLCSVIERNGNRVVLKATSEVIIQKWTIKNPICLPDLKTYSVIGETLTLECCYNDSNPNTTTTLKSGNGQLLPTEFDGFRITHNLNVTKEDHNAMFVCQSRRNGTNEIRSCSIGPITVNYKPEINITKISQLEFLCTAEARPPVNVTRWIVEPSIPEDSFTISNEVLKITEPSKVDSEMKITCEAENYIGKETKTLNISISNNQDEEEKDSISVVIIVLSVLPVSCLVTIFVIVSVYFCKSKHNQMQKTDNDDTIVDHRLSINGDGYQIPIKNIHGKYKSFNIDESMNTEEDETVVASNPKGQSLEDTSVSTTYVNTLDNRHPCQIQETGNNEIFLDLVDDNEVDIEYENIFNLASNTKGVEVTSSSAMYVNTPRVKKRQFTDNLHPTKMGNGEYDDTADYDDKETDAEDYENPNAESSKTDCPETPADVHYVNLKVKHPSGGGRPRGQLTKK